jgi:hypothetical protein
MGRCNIFLTRVGLPRASKPPLTLRRKVLDNKEHGAILPLEPLETLRMKQVSHPMENPLPTGSSGLYQIPPGAFRELIANAIGFWELRRLIYNFVLFAVVVAWVAGTWPHFRPMFEVHSLLLLAILALLANACYCAAYLVDIPLQCSALGAAWRRRRWTLWLAGTLFAILLANYWIVDEIYPFVR